MGAGVTTAHSITQNSFPFLLLLVPGAKKRTAVLSTRP